jgi:hypothetical protein
MILPPLSRMRPPASALHVTANQELKRIDGESEKITDSPFGEDDAWCARIALKFAAESSDVYVNTAVENIVLNARRVQDLFAGHRLQGGIEQS